MMKKLPKKLTEKLELRQQENSLRSLTSFDFSVDFFSNDYLGFAQNRTLFHQTHQYLVAKNWVANGATGSRLISGNHPVFEPTEAFIAGFHEAEAALVFNSGFDANLGVLSAVPQRNDLILYDELCHASIREGIQLAAAKAYKFAHNDVEHLSDLLEKYRDSYDECYIITESVFSMDGDCAPLLALSALARKTNARIIVDEAHALGVMGEKGQGLVQSLGLSDVVFARIFTFGKALGCHGSAIVGSHDLKIFLLNFARSFIYTTALSPHAIATIFQHYKHLNENQEPILNLKKNIAYYKNALKEFNPTLKSNETAIQTLVFDSLETTQRIAKVLQNQNIGVKVILSPTVKKGQERIRICLHAFNNQQEIDLLFQEIKQAL
uniref:aminotransferase class I/II-fold pyridoxal phosphate-dependent enzyme n=2 Tax=Flavobacterium sp. TaxID=239 RepID=UPI004049A616